MRGRGPETQRTRGVDVWRGRGMERWIQVEVYTGKGDREWGRDREVDTGRCIQGEGETGRSV